METPRPHSARGDFFCLREMASLSLFWRIFESAFQQTYRICPLEADPECLFAWQPAVHRGPDVRLTDSHPIYAGDPLLELHFRREALLPLLEQGASDPAHLGLGLLRLADRDVPRLARALRDRPEFAHVRGLHAITLFHRGIQRYGFEVRPLEPRTAEWWFTLWQRQLMARDHPAGNARVRPFRDRLVARHVWCTPEMLIRRYGNSPAAPTTRPNEHETHRGFHSEE